MTSSTTFCEKAPKRYLSESRTHNLTGNRRSDLDPAFQTKGAERIAGFRTRTGVGKARDDAVRMIAPGTQSKTTLHGNGPT
jgi:hypothetical protein